MKIGLYETNRCYFGDALELSRKLPDDSVHCIVTSPPYWNLRDYGVDGQLGLEKTPEEYVDRLVTIFRELRRALRVDGTLWLNLGDSYVSGGRRTRDPGQSKKHRPYEDDNFTNGLRPDTPDGLKPKNLVGIPWRVAFALQADEWYLRQDIIWQKPNSMPESVTDRCTKAHEYIFLLSKSEKYFYDADAIREKLNSDPSSWGRHSNKDPGINAPNPRPMFGPKRGGRDGTEWGNGETRNRRSVWTVSTIPYQEAHFAVFPPCLIKPCILAGCPEGGTVLDPFIGSGTTGMVAQDLGRRWLGFELQKEYASLIKKRTRQRSLFEPSS